MSEEITVKLIGAGAYLGAVPGLVLAASGPYFSIVDATPENIKTVVDMFNYSLYPGIVGMTMVATGLGLDLLEMIINGPD